MKKLGIAFLMLFTMISGVIFSACKSDYDGMYLDISYKTFYYQDNTMNYDFDEYEDLDEDVFNFSLYEEVDGQTIDYVGVEFKVETKGSKKTSSVELWTRSNTNFEVVSTSYSNGATIIIVKFNNAGVSVVDFTAKESDSCKRQVTFNVAYELESLTLKNLDSAPAMFIGSKIDLSEMNLFNFLGKDGQTAFSTDLYFELNSTNMREKNYNKNYLTSVSSDVNRLLLPGDVNADYITFTNDGELSVSSAYFEYSKQQTANNTPDNIVYWICFTVRPMVLNDITKEYEPSREISCDVNVLIVDSLDSAVLSYSNVSMSSTDGNIADEYILENDSIIDIFTGKQEDVFRTINTSDSTKVIDYTKAGIRVTPFNDDYNFIKPLSNISSGSVSLLEIFNYIDISYSYAENYIKVENGLASGSFKDYTITFGDAGFTDELQQITFKVKYTNLIFDNNVSNEQIVKDISLNVKLNKLLDGNSAINAYQVDELGNASVESIESFKLYDEYSNNSSLKIKFEKTPTDANLYDIYGNLLSNFQLLLTESSFNAINVLDSLGRLKNYYLINLNIGGRVESYYAFNVNFGETVSFTLKDNYTGSDEIFNLIMKYSKYPLNFCNENTPITESDIITETFSLRVVKTPTSLKIVNPLVSEEIGLSNVDLPIGNALRLKLLLEGGQEFELNGITISSKNGSLLFGTTNNINNYTDHLTIDSYEVGASYSFYVYANSELNDEQIIVNYPSGKAVSVMCNAVLTESRVDVENAEFIYTKQDIGYETTSNITLADNALGLALLKGGVITFNLPDDLNINTISTNVLGAGDINTQIQNYLPDAISLEMLSGNLNEFRVYGVRAGATAKIKIGISFYIVENGVAKLDEVYKYIEIAVYERVSNISISRTSDNSFVYYQDSLSPYTENLSNVDYLVDYNISSATRFVNFSGGQVEVFNMSFAVNYKSNDKSNVNFKVYYLGNVYNSNEIFGVLNPYASRDISLNVITKPDENLSRIRFILTTSEFGKKLDERFVDTEVLEGVRVENILLNGVDYKIVSENGVNKIRYSEYINLNESKSFEALISNIDYATYPILGYNIQEYAGADYIQFGYTSEQLEKYIAVDGSNYTINTVDNETEEVLGGGIFVLTIGSLDSFDGSVYKNAVQIYIYISDGVNLPYFVDSLDDLKNISVASDKTFALIKDIDASELDSQICEEFSGELLGYVNDVGTSTITQYKIYNLKLSESFISATSTANGSRLSMGIFGRNLGKISSITFEISSFNVDIENPTEVVSLGLICGVNEADGIIENASVKLLCDALINLQADINTSDANISLFVGENYGLISSDYGKIIDSNNYQFVVNYYNQAVETRGINISTGALAGVNAGSILGAYDYTSSIKGSVYSLINLQANIKVYSYSGSISNVGNNVDLANFYTAGAVGINSGKISNICANVAVNSYDYVGGFIGVNEGVESEAFNLYLLGAQLTSLNSSDSCVGGIAGKISSVQNFENNRVQLLKINGQNSFIQGALNVGGIAGLLENGNINFCYVERFYSDTYKNTDDSINLVGENYKYSIRNLSGFDANLAGIANGSNNITNSFINASFYTDNASNIKTIPDGSNYSISKVYYSGNLPNVDLNGAYYTFESIDINSLTSSFDSKNYSGVIDSFVTQSNSDNIIQIHLNANNGLPIIAYEFNGNIIYTNTVVPTSASAVTNDDKLYKENLQDNSLVEEIKNSNLLYNENHFTGIKLQDSEAVLFYYESDQIYNENAGFVKVQNELNKYYLVVDDSLILWETEPDGASLSYEVNILSGENVADLGIDELGNYYIVLKRTGDVVLEISSIFNEDIKSTFIVHSSCGFTNLDLSLNNDNEPISTNNERVVLYVNQTKNLKPFIENVYNNFKFNSIEFNNLKLKIYAGNNVEITGNEFEYYNFDDIIGFTGVNFYEDGQYKDFSIIVEYYYLEDGNYYYLCSKEIDFRTYKTAISIELDVNKFETEPSEVVDFVVDFNTYYAVDESSYLYLDNQLENGEISYSSDALILSIMGSTDNDNEQIFEILQKTNKSSVYDLFEVNYAVSKLGFTYSYQISLSLVDDFEIRYLVDQLSFKLMFRALTDEDVKNDSLTIVYSPENLSTVRIEHYSSGTIVTNSNANNKVEYISGTTQSNVIVPGNSGLLKLYIEPSYSLVNDLVLRASYGQISGQRITFQQMIYDGTKYISLSHSSNYGFMSNGSYRLEKISSYDSTTNSYSYNGVIYVRTILNDVEGNNELYNIYLDIYKSNIYGNGSADETLTKTLISQYLPGVYISVSENSLYTSIDGNNYYILQRGAGANSNNASYIDVAVVGYELIGLPNYQIIGDNIYDKVYLVQSQEAVYDETSGRYNIRYSVFVRSDLFEKFSIKFSMELVKDGITYTQEKLVNFITTDYILDSINVTNLHSTINSSATLFMNLNSLNGEIDLNEFLIDNQGVIDDNKVINFLKNFRLSNGDLSNYYVPQSQLQSALTDPNNANKEFLIYYDSISKTFRIYGRMISNFSVTVEVPYTFKFADDFKNYVELSFDVSGLSSYYVAETNFNITISTSTDENQPLAIYNAEQFMNMNAGGNFILMEDINLYGYSPISFNDSNVIFSLDGNNKVINIYSFDVSGKTNIGLFESLGQNSILKNVTVNIANLQTVNLSGVNSFNFGLLAGTNEGIIYNCEVISFNPNQNSKVDSVINILSQDSVSSSASHNLIGLLVGENLGNIINSRVGTSSFKKVTVSVNSLGANNTVENIISCGTITLNARGVVAGLVAVNSGIISSCYVANTTVNNLYELNNSYNMTAGLVAENSNSGKILYSYVEGLQSSISQTSLRASTNKIYSYIGSVGAFVYTNSGTISDCYANIFVESNTQFVSGFAYINENSGKILQSYSVGNISSNSTSNQPFIGANLKNELNSFGEITDCYYLKLDSDKFSVIIDGSKPNAVELNSVNIQSSDSFNNFCFIDGVETSEQGVWTLKNSVLPKLVSANQIAVSVKYFYGGVSYFADDYAYGSSINPYIVRDVEEFNTYIAFDNETSATSKFFNGYIRLVDDIDFTGLDMETRTEMDMQGVIDGNGMTLSGLYIGPTQTSQSSIGLFSTITNGIVKNLNIEFDTIEEARGSSYVGGLAGIIDDSIILNVTLSGENKMLTGDNFVGGLAGLVRGESVLFNISSNLSVKATVRNLENYIRSGEYNFAYEYLNEEDFNYQNFGFSYSGYNTYNEYLRNLSYAGGIAGVLDLDESPINENAKRLQVYGNVQIVGVNAGGIAGYTSIDTSIKKGYVELSNGSFILGVYSSGGIAGINYGDIYQSKVQYSDNDNFRERIREYEQNPSESNIEISNQRIVENAYYQDQVRIGSSSYYSLLLGSVYVGGVAGINFAGEIYNTLSSVVVYTDSEYLSGFVGLNIGGKFNYVYSNSLVKLTESNSFMGGMFAYIMSATDKKINIENGSYYSNSMKALEVYNKFYKNVDGNDDLSVDLYSVVSGIAYDNKLISLFNSNQSKSYKNLFVGYIDENVVFVNDSVNSSTDLDTNTFVTVYYKAEQNVITNISSVYNFNTYDSNLLNTKTDRSSEQKALFRRMFGNWPIEYWDINNQSKEIYFPPLLDKSINNYYEISSSEDMGLIGLYPDANFVVTNDITISAYNYVADVVFTGSIVGVEIEDASGVKRLPKITIDLSLSNFNGAKSITGAGFFKQTENAIVRNLDIEYTIKEVNANQELRQYFGGISSMDIGSSFENLYVSFDFASGNSEITNISFEQFGGLIANSTDSFITSCVVNIGSDENIQEIDFIKAGNNKNASFGGIVGHADSSIKLDENNENYDYVILSTQANLYIDLHIDAINSYVGGVVGDINNKVYLSSATASGKLNVYSVDNTNSNQISIGGIIGYAKNVVFDNIYISNLNISLNINSNKSSQFDKSIVVGGIVGEALNMQGENSYSKNSTITNKVSSNNSYIYGGLIGKISAQSSLKNSVSNIEIIDEYSKYLTAGGITGSNSTEVEYLNVFSNTLMSLKTVDTVEDSLNILVGGLIGNVLGDTTISDSISAGRINLATNSYQNVGKISVGGIIGIIENGKILVTRTITISAISTSQISKTYKQVDAVDVFVLNQDAVIGENLTSDYNIEVYYSSDYTLCDSNIGSNYSVDALLSKQFVKLLEGFTNNYVGNEIVSIPYMSSIKNYLVLSGVMNEEGLFDLGSAMRPISINNQNRTNAITDSGFNYYYLKENLDDKFNCTFAFEGIILGNNKTINITNFNLFNGYMALIPEISNNSAISNITLTLNNDISLTQKTGLLVGVNNGNIYSCSVNFDGISLTSGSETAFVAHTNNGNISNSYSSAELKSGVGATSGFVYLNNNVIQNSYFNGYIGALNSSGFIFDNGENSYLENCYSAGVVQGLKQFGNIAEVNTVWKNVYFDKYATNSLSEENNTINIKGVYSVNLITLNNIDLGDEFTANIVENTSDGKFNNTYTIKNFGLNFGYPTIITTQYILKLDDETNSLKIVENTYFGGIDSVVVKNETIDENESTIITVLINHLGTLDSVRIYENSGNFANAFTYLNNKYEINSNRSIKYNIIYDISATSDVGGLSGNWLSLGLENLKTDAGNINYKDYAFSSNNFNFTKDLSGFKYRKISNEISAIYNLSGQSLFNSISNSKISTINFGGTSNFSTDAGLIATNMISSSEIYNIKVLNNAKINSSQAVGGNLGGLVGNMSNGSIYDITYLSNVTISATNGYIGAIVGYMSGGNIGKVEANTILSSIRIEDLKFDNNQNTLHGGIIGYLEDGNIYLADDINKTKINITAGSNVGGIAGIAKVQGIKNEYRDDGSWFGFKIENESIITIQGTDSLGGLYAKVEDLTFTSNVSINATLNGVSNVGGIVGRIEDNSSMTTSSNITVEFTGSIGLNGFASTFRANFGGIVGLLSNSNLSAGESGAFVNNGSIGNQYEYTLVNIGGIVGQANGSSSVTNVTNKGNVYGLYNVGGIIGLSTGEESANINVEITNAINEGNVYGNLGFTDSGEEIVFATNIGGIVGRAYKSIFVDTQMKGRVELLTEFNGINTLKSVKNNFIVNNAISKQLNSELESGIGGFAGSLSDVQFSENNSILGEIDARNGVNVGAIAGYVYDLSTSIPTINTINVSGSYYIGGYFGKIGEGVNLELMTFSGSINIMTTNYSANYVGGIIGYSKVDISGLYIDDTTSGQINIFNKNVSYAGGLIGCLEDANMVNLIVTDDDGHYLTTINNGYAVNKVIFADSDNLNYGGLVGVLRQTDENINSLTIEGEHYSQFTVDTIEVKGIKTTSSSMSSKQTDNNFILSATANYTLNTEFKISNSSNFTEDVINGGNPFYNGKNWSTDYTKFRRMQRIIDDEANDIYSLEEVFNFESVYDYDGTNTTLILDRYNFDYVGQSGERQDLIKYSGKIYSTENISEKPNTRNIWYYIKDSFKKFANSTLTDVDRINNYTNTGKASLINDYLNQNSSMSGVLSALNSRQIAYDSSGRILATTDNYIVLNDAEGNNLVYYFYSTSEPADFGENEGNYILRNGVYYIYSGAYISDENSSESNYVSNVPTVNSGNMHELYYDENKVVYVYEFSEDFKDFVSDDPDDFIQVNSYYTLDLSDENQSAFEVQTYWQYMGVSNEFDSLETALNSVPIYKTLYNGLSENEKLYVEGKIFTSKVFYRYSDSINNTRPSRQVTENIYKDYNSYLDGEEPISTSTTAQYLTTSDYYKLGNYYYIYNKTDLVEQYNSYEELSNGNYKVTTYNSATEGLNKYKLWFASVDRYGKLYNQDNDSAINITNQILLQYLFTDESSNYNLPTIKINQYVGHVHNGYVVGAQRTPVLKDGYSGIYSYSKKSNNGFVQVTPVDDYEYEPIITFVEKLDYLKYGEGESQIYTLYFETSSTFIKYVNNSDMLIEKNDSKINTYISATTNGTDLAIFDGNGNENVITFYRGTGINGADQYSLNNSSVIYDITDNFVQQYSNYYCINDGKTIPFVSSDETVLTFIKISGNRVFILSTDFVANNIIENGETNSSISGDVRKIIYNIADTDTAYTNRYRYTINGQDFYTRYYYDYNSGNTNIDIEELLQEQLNENLNYTLIYGMNSDNLESLSLNELLVRNVIFAEGLVFNFAGNIS